MAKKIVIDSFVENELTHSRIRIQKSWNSLATIRSTVDASKKAIEASRRLIKSIPNRRNIGVEHAITQDPLLAMDDETLRGLVNDLIAAHHQAYSVGNDAAAKTFETALIIIARRLAEQIGPKAAGIPLS